MRKVCGVGIRGDVYVGKKPVREYILWKNMLQRCYSSKYHEVLPTYKGCTVSDNFIHYSYFNEWCKNQTGFDNIGWHLDKDLLVKNNKVYSEDKCVFLPAEVNVLLTNRKNFRGDLPVGVYYHESKKKYTASISYCGKQRQLGHFLTIDDAFCAYKKAKEEYMRSIADKWRDVIDERSYNALMRREISIND